MDVDAAEERQRQQRCLAHHKAPPAIHSQELSELLLLLSGRNTSPVRSFEGQRDVTPDFLQRCRQALPAKSRA